MSKPGCDTPLRGNGKLQDVWKVQWTYVGGVPTFDKVQSDVDPTFAQSLIITNTGGGIVTVRFPKCSKMNVIGKNLLPNSSTTLTDYRIHEVVTQSPTTGTCVVKFVTVAGAFASPTDGSRYQLTLLLDG